MKKIESKTQIEKIKKSSEISKESIPPLPEGIDSFEYYSGFEPKTKVTAGRLPRTLIRAKNKLEASGACNCRALSVTEINYFCKKCHAEYTHDKIKILSKTFSICPDCAIKERIRKSHESRMAREFKEMEAAAKKQNITILSTKIEKAKDGIKCINSKGKPITITYQQFKCRRGILDPDFKKGGTSIPEAVCRSIIEQLTGKPFPKGYPSGWTYPVKNQKEKSFSVDMYNARDFETPIAFEYWGREVHYAPKASSTKFKGKDISRTQENDRKKAEYARLTNTKLIILKGYDNYKSLKRVTEDIKKILSENNIPFNPDAEIHIDTDTFEIEDLYTRVKNECENHKPKGILKTTFIPNYNTDLEIICTRHNESFRSTPIKILYTDHWNCESCKLEAVRERLSLNEEKINKRLESITVYPHKISFVRFLEDPSSHAKAEWVCSKHGAFPKRVDSVLYKNYGRVHACPECEKIMYPKKGRKKSNK